MIVHPTPVPHAHGCPRHPGGSAVSLVSCAADDPLHNAAWHAAVDPLVAQAVIGTKEITVPAATLATLA